MPAVARLLLQTCILTSLHLCLLVLRLYDRLERFIKLNIRSRRRLAQRPLQDSSLSSHKVAPRLREKLPRVLAINAVIPSGSATGLRPDTLVQLEQLVQWCASSSVEHLLLYDRQGCLRQNAAAICKALARNATVADCTRPEARHRTFDVQLQRQKIRISMLDAQDGRAHIARVGQVLASAVRQGYLAPKEIDIALLDDKLIDSLVPAPDLMIVLGGTYCRLHGFPPWHLRLTEFYHVPSPLWSWNSTPTQLSRAHFEQALDLYSDCEMRQGK